MAVTCGHCGRHDHYSEMCPKQAADVRGEGQKALADYERTGRGCSICGHGDHREEHHRHAVMDWMARSGSPAAGGPSSGIPPPPPAPGGGAGGGGRKPKDQTSCKFGKNCAALNDKNGNKCEWKHTQEEVNAAEAKRQQKPADGSPPAQRQQSPGKGRVEVCPFLPPREGTSFRSPWSWYS